MNTRTNSNHGAFRLFAALLASAILLPSCAPEPEPFVLDPQQVALLDEVTIAEAP